MGDRASAVGGAGERPGRGTPTRGLPFRRWLPLGLTASALLVAPTALATEGSLYSVGVGALANHVTPDGSCTARQTGAVFGVSCPAGDPVLAGPKWQIDVRSPWLGTTVEHLGFRALRWHDPATSLAVQVLADGRPAWSVAERDVPRHPAQPKRYLVRTSGASASLRLVQTETRRQPPRVYSILEPTIHVRDLQPPQATLLSIPSGWVTRDEARINWHVADNLGDDGVATQRLHVGDRLVFSGTPGSGQHAVSADLRELADGVHPVRLEVEGDGTAPAPPQTGALQLDRTAPRAAVDVAPLPGERARITVTVADATSGMREWTLGSSETNAAAIMAGTTTGDAREIALSDHLAPGASTRLMLQAIDEAGNVRIVLSPPLTRPLPSAASSGSATPRRVGAAPPRPEQATTSGGRVVLRPPTYRPALLSPRAGALVRSPRPLLRWSDPPLGTALSNLQVFRMEGGALTKLHSAFPRRRAYRLPSGLLAPGETYVWRVWPYRTRTGFTRRPLGVSWFRAAAATRPPPVAARARMIAPATGTSPRGRPLALRWAARAGIVRYKLRLELRGRTVLSDLAIGPRYTVPGDVLRRAGRYVVTVRAARRGSLRRFARAPWARAAVTVR